MSLDNEKRTGEVSAILQQALNEHGFGFQYAVLGFLDRLRRERKSAWVLESAEFPVEVRGVPTHIDFVLSRRMEIGVENLPRYYLLAECKRANPAFSDWCFLRAPYTRSNRTDNWVVFDKAFRAYEKTVVISAYKLALRDKNHPSYEIAVEVKTQSAGNRIATQKGALDTAVGQVLRGANGMLEFLVTHPHVFPPSKLIALIPVIFTTATLWVSGADLSAASLETGNIDLANLPLSCVNWLLYDYNMSPGLKHQQQLGGDDGTQRNISESIEREYVRTVAVVNAAGIVDFLNWTNLADGP